MNNSCSYLHCFGREDDSLNASLAEKRCNLVKKSNMMSEKIYVKKHISKKISKFAQFKKNSR